MVRRLGSPEADHVANTGVVSLFTGNADDEPLVVGIDGEEAPVEWAGAGGGSEVLTDHQPDLRSGHDEVSVLCPARPGSQSGYPELTIWEVGRSPTLTRLKG